MHTISIADIVISENRQRQEFDPEALQELADSIESGQLMHPIVLRQSGDVLTLVAGERRLRAIQQIFDLGGEFVCNGQTFTADSGMIPYLSLGELSYLEAEEAELDENLKRRDLTWQEKAAAWARLHALRTAQVNEENIQLENSGDDTTPLTPAHTVADTAEEVLGRRDGAYHETVRQNLILAKHLDNPAIAKAKSSKEAYKILKAEEETKRNVELAASVGKVFSSKSHTLLNVNCLEWMARPENAGSVDVILTDPPYGMGAHEFGDGGGKLTGITHIYDDSYESWQKLITAWAPLSYTIAKPQAHAYVFCDIDRFHELKRHMEEAGWYVFRTPFTIVKEGSGRVPLPDRGPRRQSEWLLYAIKGDKPVTHIYPDVITAKADEQLGHGAQKPVAIYENLLQRSVRPGDVVFDGFCGSGPIFPAASTFKCYAIGTEMDPGSYGISLKRLQNLQQGEELTEGLL